MTKCRSADVYFSQQTMQFISSKIAIISRINTKSLAILDKSNTYGFSDVIILMTEINHAHELFCSLLFEKKKGKNHRRFPSSLLSPPHTSDVNKRVLMLCLSGIRCFDKGGLINWGSQFGDQM